MKKPISSVSGIVLIFCASLLPLFVFSENQRLSAEEVDKGNSAIQNSGFEMGTVSWTQDGEGIVAVTDEKAHSGNYSMKISSTVQHLAYFYQYIDFPRTSFTFSFWIFRVDPDSFIACYFARDWDSFTIRAVSTLVIGENTIELDAWDDPYSPGRQVFNYDVTAGSWHNITFAANSVSKTQDFFVDGNLLHRLQSSSGNVFPPNILIFGDVNNEACKGTVFFDDFKLEASETSLSPSPSSTNEPLCQPTLTTACASFTEATRFKVEIRGNLSYGSIGLAGSPILISYSVTCGNSWIDLTSATTDDNGNFLVVWQPSVTGNYLVRSVWPGNDTFRSATDTVSLVVAPD